MNTTELEQHPNPLASYYSQFKVSERLLLTGHSHQAWPDCALIGQQKAWQDAAEFVDFKWEKAEKKAIIVRRHFSSLINDDNGLIALGQNTYDLTVSFLSALPWQKKHRIVTSDREFHSLRRLLDRLSEENIELVKIASDPLDTFLERMINAVNDKTTLVCCSKVFYDNGLIVENLKPLAEYCQQLGVELLIDAYHALNLLPFSLEEEGLENAYVLGGGYKYCQFGEGNCFIRFPKTCQLRPIATGWYGEVENYTSKNTQGIQYHDDHRRFAGATYDPTAHYRAAEVIQFFNEQALTPSRLRKISQAQLGLMQENFLNQDIDPKIVKLDSSIHLEQRGGFLAFETPYADQLQKELFRKGLLCNSRGQYLRLGPAPYLSNLQLLQAMNLLNEVVSETAFSKKLS